MYVLRGEPRNAKRYEEARRLRRLGRSIKAIAREVGAAPSTISYWVHDIELTPEQVETNNARAERARNDSWRRLNRDRRLDYQEDGRLRARVGEPLHVAGCMLYWAEGAKARNRVKFTNSDPAMLTTFVRFLRECFGITADDITFSVNVYTNNGKSIDDIEAYWVDLLSLSHRCARKHMLDHTPTSSSGGKRNRLPYGVCTVVVKRSTWLVQHIYGAIQEYSGIDQPAWLDGPPRKPKAT
jgi:hypothetical protein